MKIMKTSMLKSLTRTALTATTLMLAATGAHAGSAKWKEFIFDVKSPVTTLHVVSSDGEKWDTLLPGNVKFWAHMRLDTRWPGYVVDVGVVLGNCSGSICDSFPVLWTKFVIERDYNGQRYFTVPTSLLTDSTPGLGLQSQNIIDKCNEGLAADGPTKEHDFEESFGATFVADTEKRWGGLNGLIYEAHNPFAPPLTRNYPREINHAKSGTFTVTVVCDAFPKKAELPPPPRATPKPVAVDLTVTQRGSTCPKTVTATAYADYLSPRTKARLRLSVGNGFPKIRVVKTRKVEAFGKTWHRAQADFNFTLDPGQKTFKLRVDGNEASKTKTVTIDCPPFEVTSAWLKYEVAKTDRCPRKVIETATFKTTRPGWVDYAIKRDNGAVMAEGRLTATRQGNGYAATAMRELTVGEIDAQFMADVKNRPANSGWVPLKIGCMDVLGGELTLTDSGGTQCPRHATALVNIQTDLEGPVPYRLDCSGGRSWTRAAMAKKMPTGKYVAVDLIQFDIAKTEKLACGLKSLVGGETKQLDFKGRKFQCVTPAVETGSNDIQVAPRPNSRDPRVPATLVPKAPDKAKAEAEPRRLQAAKKRAEEARKKAEARRKRAEAAKKAAAARRKREAAKKAAEARRKRAEAAKKAAAARRKREAAKKAAEARRKRAKAAKKAAAARRKREAAKKAAEALRKKRAAKNRRASIR